jgi:hypothetical protein
MPANPGKDGKIIQFQVGIACWENFRRIGEPLGLTANTAARYLAMKALEQSRTNEALSGMGSIFKDLTDAERYPSNPNPKRRKP